MDIPEKMMITGKIRSILKTVNEVIWIDNIGEFRHEEKSCKTKIPYKCTNQKLEKNRLVPSLAISLLQSMHHMSHVCYVVVVLAKRLACQLNSHVDFTTIWYELSSSMNSAFLKKHSWQKTDQFQSNCHQDKQHWKAIIWGKRS